MATTKTYYKVKRNPRTFRVEIWYRKWYQLKWHYYNDYAYHNTALKVIENLKSQEL